MKKLITVSLGFLVVGCGVQNQDLGKSGLDNQAQRAVNCTSISFDGSAPSPVCYQVVDGKAVVQGDIALFEVKPGEKIKENDWRGALTSTGAYLQQHTWTKGVIPYDVDPSLPNVARVQNSIAHYHQKTSIRFVPRTTQSDWVTFRRKPGIACYSALGRTGGQQFIDLDDACSTGNTIHEIGHAIGLWHEQGRMDRDQYVTINFANMIPGQESAFAQNPQYSKDFGAYDYSSIMHYFATAFSKNGLPTITKKDGSTDFGRKEELSAGDLAAVAAIYGGANGVNNTAAVTIGSKHVFAAGPSTGPGIVRVWDAQNGQEILQVNPFPGFGGGINVAVGDVDGDTYLDVITAVRSNGPPHVMAFSGKTGQMIRSFYAYGAGYPGGVSVASGDVNGDGYDDIITAAMSGAGPHVMVFDGKTNQPIASFFAYTATFTGGVTVAAGDVDGDGMAEIITGAGPGAGPHVRVFKFNGGNPTPIMEFFAYDPNFKGGITLGAGDLNRDGQAEIITGIRTAGGPHVTGRPWNNPNALYASFFAYAPQFLGGVNVAATEFAGQPAILTGPGAGGGAHVRVTNTAGQSLWEAMVLPGAVGATVGGR